MDASEAPARNLHHACGPSGTVKGLSELITIDVKLEDRRQSDVDTGKGIDCIEVEQASGLVKALSALAREQLANAGRRFGEDTVAARLHDPGGQRGVVAGETRNRNLHTHRTTLARLQFHLAKGLEFA